MDMLLQQQARACVFCCVCTVYEALDNKTERQEQWRMIWSFVFVKIASGFRLGFGKKYYVIY